MRRNLPFILYLAFLSLLAGWLLSKMSWIGRLGINTIHKEYKFLKVWYGGAAVLFGVLMVLFIIQGLFQKRSSRAAARTVHIVAMLLAVAGLFYTYHDFSSDFTHRILKERFHLGAYLFWIGWISISIFFLTGRSTSKDLAV